VTRHTVTKLRIQGFGCIRDVSLSLTPLHAIIGPSDSGKTTVLRALRALSHYAQKLNVHAAMTEFSLYAHEGTTLEAHVAGAGMAIITRDRGGWGEHHIDEEARGALGGHHMLHFDPEALRQASSLIPEGAPLRFADERGLGLPALYDAILSRDVGTYLELSERLAQAFPTVKTISLKNPNQQTKVLGVQLEDGSFVSASAMSEGLLRFLAFAAVPWLSPAGLLLVEEPENGLHPARVRDVVALLREVSRTTQVVIATHSPFVVEALEDDEVTILGRAKDTGTEAFPVKSALTGARAKALGLGRDDEEEDDDPKK
jgi:predicted ATPase